jgi:hypothetical protein
MPDDNKLTAADPKAPGAGFVGYNIGMTPPAPIVIPLIDPPTAK